MKKRIMAIFLAFAMVVSLVPAATLTSTAVEKSKPYGVKLIANFTGENLYVISSDPVDISNGPGEYTVKLTVPSTTVIPATSLNKIMKLALISGDAKNLKLTDWSVIDEVPTFSDKALEIEDFDDWNKLGAWGAFGVKITEINANDTYKYSHRNVNLLLDTGEKDFDWCPWNGEDCPNGCDVDLAILECRRDAYVHVPMFNAWWANHNKFVPIGDTPPMKQAKGEWGEDSWVLENNEKFETIEVKFEILDPVEGGENAPTTGFTDIQLMARSASTWETHLAPYMSEPETIDHDGEYTLELSIPDELVWPGDNDAPNQRVKNDRLANIVIKSAGSDFCEVLPFRGKADPAPTDWKDKVFMEIKNVKINETSIGSNSPWNDFSKKSKFISQIDPADPPASGFLNSAGYVDVQLWNAWHVPSRRLTTGGTALKPLGFDMSRKGTMGFGIADGTAITKVSVTINVAGIDDPAVCSTCENELPDDCTCEAVAPGGPLGLGRVTGGTDSGMDDVLEILKFMVKIDSTLKGGNSKFPGVKEEDAFKAAQILPSKYDTDQAPGMDDVLEILKYMVKIPGAISANKGW